MWQFPRMVSLQDLAVELQEASVSEDWSFEELKQAIPGSASPVGVFNSTIDHSAQNPRKVYRTDTVTLNIARHATICDYWGQHLAAGSRLWICFVLLAPGSSSGSGPGNAAKRVLREQGVCTMAVGAHSVKQVEEQLRNELEGYTVAGAVCFYIGKCQNHLLSRQQKNFPTRITGRIPSDGSKQRLREVQVEPLLSMPYFIEASEFQ